MLDWISLHLLWPLSAQGMAWKQRFEHATILKHGTVSQASCSIFSYAVKEMSSSKRCQQSSPVPGWAEAEAAKCLCWPHAPHEGCLRLATMPGEAAGPRTRRGRALAGHPAWVQTWKRWRHVARKRKKNTDHPSMLVRKENTGGLLKYSQRISTMLLCLAQVFL